jgi:hypothetical protein
MTDTVNSDAASDVDESIPALLPRDWPRQLDELFDQLHASPAAREAARAVVDGWVLAASEAVEEMEAEILEELGVSEDTTGDPTDD